MKSFSALQRAENSSISGDTRPTPVRRAFQCSSASRKFLNWSIARCVYSFSTCFSALQRAENSSIPPSLFNPADPRRFSALQRAENSSIRSSGGSAARSGAVSVLFSEPKIPQSGGGDRTLVWCAVSVLFSEPKIPQSRPSHLRPSIFPTAMITLRHS